MSEMPVLEPPLGRFAPMWGFATLRQPFVRRSQNCVVWQSSREPLSGCNSCRSRTSPPDTRLKDYKKRRSAFLEELIASTPSVSVRAKEFRRWIDENSPHGDNDEV